MLTVKKKIQKQLEVGCSIETIARTNFPHLIKKKGLNWTLRKVEKDWIGSELMKIYNSGERFPKSTA